jgi:hypothetical protein
MVEVPRKGYRTMKIEYRLIAVIVLGMLASGQGRAETNVADAAKGGQQAAPHSATAVDHGAQQVSGKPTRVDVRPLTQIDTPRPSFNVRNARGRGATARPSASDAASTLGRPTQNQRAVAVHRFTSVALKANGVAGVSGSVMGPHASALAVLGGWATFDAKQLVRR